MTDNIKIPWAKVEQTFKEIHDQSGTEDLLKQLNHANQIDGDSQYISLTDVDGLPEQIRAQARFLLGQLNPKFFWRGCTSKTPYHGGCPSARIDAVEIKDTSANIKFTAYIHVGFYEGCGKAWAAYDSYQCSIELITGNRGEVIPQQPKCTPGIGSMLGDNHTGKAELRWGHIEQGFSVLAQKNGLPVSYLPAQPPPKISEPAPKHL